jgi:hypothetical protein
LFSQQAARGSKHYSITWVKRQQAVPALEGSRVRVRIFLFTRRAVLQPLQLKLVVIIASRSTFTIFRFIFSKEIPCISYYIDSYSAGTIAAAEVLVIESVYFIHLFGSTNTRGECAEVEHSTTIAADKRDMQQSVSQKERQDRTTAKNVVGVESPSRRESSSTCYSNTSTFTIVCITSLVSQQQF